jgi:hypothetical protein
MRLDHVERRGARRGWRCSCGAVRRPSLDSLYRGMPLAVDLDDYAAQAEQFVGAMDREYYLHLAGPQARVRDRADLRAPRRAVHGRWWTNCEERLPPRRPG